MTMINGGEGCSLEGILGQDYWYGNRNTSDVVVSFIQSFSNFQGKIAFASINEGSTSKDEKNFNTDPNVNKKRKLSMEGSWDLETNVKEPNLEALHVHSHQLRHCSKYFDSCLCKRWEEAGVETSSTRSKIVHLSLDVHIDVKYYKECFSRMYSPSFLDIPNVKHCLKLVRVAIQISYQELIEACLSYLTTIPWSWNDEKRIQKFANSSYYPSDCASDLSARLGLPKSTEIYNYVFDTTQSVLQNYFDDAMQNPKGLPEYEPWASSRDMFPSAFRRIIAGSCQSLVKNILKYVNDNMKTYIGKAEVYYKKIQMDGRFDVPWILNILLETRCAKELMEYIAEESTLEQTIRAHNYGFEIEWFNVVLFIFKEMNEGHLLLKTSTRYKLLQEWTWILFQVEDAESKREVRRVLSAFVTTFPHEQQKEIFSIWLKNAPAVIDSEPEDLFFESIHEDWIVYLQERIMSLEQQQSTLHGTCQNVSECSTIASSSSEPTLSSTSNPHSSPRSDPTSRSY